MYESRSEMVQRRHCQHHHRPDTLEYTNALSQRSQSTPPPESRPDSCLCSGRSVSERTQLSHTKRSCEALLTTTHAKSVCLVSIARLGPLYIIATTNDVSLHNGPAAFLSSMEVNVAIICASLPSLRAITLRTWSQRHSHHHQQPTSTHHSHSGWWRFGRQNDDIELEGGQRQDLNDSGSAITKSVTIEMSTKERRGSRKSSIWSLPFHGGIFDGGIVTKAHIKSSIR